MIMVFFESILKIHEYVISELCSAAVLESSFVVPKEIVSVRERSLANLSLIVRVLEGWQGALLAVRIPI